MPALTGSTNRCSGTWPSGGPYQRAGVDPGVAPAGPPPWCPGRRRRPCRRRARRGPGARASRGRPAAPSCQRTLPPALVGAVGSWNSAGPSAPARRRRAGRPGQVAAGGQGEGTLAGVGDVAPATRLAGEAGQLGGEPRLGAGPVEGVAALVVLQVVLLRGGAVAPVLVGHRRHDDVARRPPSARAARTAACTRRPDSTVISNGAPTSTVAPRRSTCSGRPWGSRPRAGCSGWSQRDASSHFGALGAAAAVGLGHAGTERREPPEDRA